jgi:hypothetical protein
VHALDDEKVMKWDKEMCYCWHELNLVLKFLDGVSSEEAKKMKYGECRGLHDFLQSDAVNTMEQPLWLLQIHTIAWKYYGQRLFRFFDIRSPEQWQGYTKFVKEFYGPGYSSTLLPLPIDKLC